MRKKPSFNVVSHKDRDDLYAELWWGDEQWGEINLERDGRQTLKIHPPNASTGYEFDLQAVLEMLERAGKHLREIEGLAG